MGKEFVVVESVVQLSIGTPKNAHILNGFIFILRKEKGAHSDRVVLLYKDNLDKARLLLLYRDSWDTAFALER